MYYDTKPCGFNGLFDSDVFCDVLKGYYPFKMFNELYKLGTACAVVNDECIYTCAATNGDKAAVVLTHFTDEDDNAPACEVQLNLQGFIGNQGVKASYYVLDKNLDLELVKEEIFHLKNYTTVLKAELFTSYLILLEKC